MRERKKPGSFLLHERVFFLIRVVPIHLLLLESPAWARFLTLPLFSPPDAERPQTVPRGHTFSPPPVILAGRSRSRPFLAFHRSIDLFFPSNDKTLPNNSLPRTPSHQQLGTFKRRPRILLQIETFLLSSLSLAGVFSRLNSFPNSRNSTHFSTPTWGGYSYAPRCKPFLTPCGFGPSDAHEDLAFPFHGQKATRPFFPRDHPPR